MAFPPPNLLLPNHSKGCMISPKLVFSSSNYGMFDFSFSVPRCHAYTQLESYTVQQQLRFLNNFPLGLVYAYLFENHNFHRVYQGSTHIDEKPLLNHYMVIFNLFYFIQFANISIFPSTHVYFPTS